MEYMDMLNKIALSNAMLKRAKSLAEAFGYKPPKEIKYRPLPPNVEPKSLYNDDPRKTKKLTEEQKKYMKEDKHIEERLGVKTHDPKKPSPPEIKEKKPTRIAEDDKGKKIVSKTED